MPHSSIVALTVNIYLHIATDLFALFRRQHHPFSYDVGRYLALVPGDRSA